MTGLQLTRTESTELKLESNQQEQTPKPHSKPEINATHNFDIPNSCNTKSNNSFRDVTPRFSNPNAVKIVADGIAKQLEELSTNSRLLLLLVMIFAVIVLITGLILLGFGLYGIYDPEFALLKLFLAIINPVIIGYQLSMLVNTYLWFCDHFCCARRAHTNNSNNSNNRTQDRIDCQTLITWLVFCAGTITVMIMQLYIYSFEFDAVLLMVAFVLETMLKVLENEQQIAQQKNLEEWKRKLNKYLPISEKQQQRDNYTHSYTPPHATYTHDTLFSSTCTAVNTSKIPSQTISLHLENDQQSQAQFESQSRIDRSKQATKVLSPRQKKETPLLSSISFAISRTASDPYSKRDHLGHIMEMVTVRQELKRTKSDLDVEVAIDANLNDIECVIKDDHDDTKTHLLQKFQD